MNRNNEHPQNTFLFQTFTVFTIHYYSSGLLQTLNILQTPRSMDKEATVLTVHSEQFVWVQAGLSTTQLLPEHGL